jgi:hypothetical protein
VDPVLIRNQGATEVRSQTYHHFSFSYQLDRGSAGLGPTDLTLAIRNAFGTPPFNAGAVNGYSPYADPRLATHSVWIVTRWGGRPVTSAVAKV